MEDNIITKKTNLKFQDYFNKINNPNLHFVEGWTNKKEHINNTFDLYFRESDPIFSECETSLLKDWLFDVVRLYKSSTNNPYPYAHPHNIKTEAIKFNDKIILKECYNLLNLINKYHTAYLLRTEHEDLLKDTYYSISFDKAKIKKKINKFKSISENLRLTKKEKAPYIMLKRALSFLVSEKYKKRAKQYINSIACNYYICNWDNILNSDNEEAKEIFGSIIHYLMYSNLSENKIKNSLGILVYTFLDKRLNLKSKDALALTNKLCHGILYDMEYKQDYFKREVSQGIYVYDVFNYLPIYAHHNEKNKDVYSEEEKEKIIHTIKKHAYTADDSFKLVDEKYFTHSFDNSHISYVMQEVIYLYDAKDE